MDKILINVKNETAWVFKKLGEIHKKDLISVDEIIGDLEEALMDLERVEEEKEHLENDLRDNYIHRPTSDYTGDSDDDRYGWF